VHGHQLCRDPFTAMLLVNQHHTDPRQVVPYVVVVVVPTTRPSLTAQKQPFGSSNSSRRQSASVWFQPASSFNRIADVISDSNNKRISNAALAPITQLNAGACSNQTVVRRLHEEIGHSFYVPIDRPT
jgi:hypothetical protein